MDFQEKSGESYGNVKGWGFAWAAPLAFAVRLVPILPWLAP